MQEWLMMAVQQVLQLRLTDKRYTSQMSSEREFLTEFGLGILMVLGFR